MTDKEEIEFRESMIKDFKDKVKAVEKMKRECIVLKDPTDWEDKKLIEYAHIIKTLTEQIEDIKTKTNKIMESK